MACLTCAQSLVQITCKGRAEARADCVTDATWPQATTAQRLSKKPNSFPKKTIGFHQKPMTLGQDGEPTSIKQVWAWPFRQFNWNVQIETRLLINQTHPNALETLEVSKLDVKGTFQKPCLVAHAQEHVSWKSHRQLWAGAVFACWVPAAATAQNKFTTISARKDRHREPNYRHTDHTDSNV